MLVLLATILVVTSDLATCRLVLDSWDDLYQDNGQADFDRLNREADLLGVTSEPYQECPEMELEIREYEIFLMEDGVEVRDTVETTRLMDTVGVQIITNSNESWIQGTVKVR